MADFNPLSPMVTGPLTDDEWTLIRRAETEPWTEDLKRRLVAACVDRSILVSNHDMCGHLAKQLEMIG